MGIKFTPKAPKPSQTAQIAALETQVAKLQAGNAAKEQLLNTLLGVSEDEE